MRRRYNGVMRIAIAVVGRVFVHSRRDYFEDHLDGLSPTVRNARIEPMIKLINLNDVDESGGSCLAIEAERRFARLGYSVSRLCGF